MDYEKKYKEMLDAARYWHDVSEGDIPAVLEEIFPELAESEDEKIRKELIHLVKKSHEQGGYALHKYEADRMLAWLEKQGENPICKVKIGEKYKCIASPRYSCFYIGDVYEVTDDFIAKLINLCSDCFVLLEEQGLEYKDGEIVKTQRRVSAEAKENGYSESEDERIMEKIIATIHLYYGEPLEDEAKEMIAWLEKQKYKDALTWVKRFYQELSHEHQMEAEALFIAWLEKEGYEPNWCHHKVDLSNCSEEYRKAYYDGWNNCNQQHSQCNSEGNDVVKCLINGMKFYYEDNEEATWGTEKFPMKVKDILSWLEKQQGEQNPAKRKPKIEQREATGVLKKILDEEDERIRKAIFIYLDWLDGRKDCAPRGEYSIRDMVAWLEKQGEKVTAIEGFSTEFEKQVSYLIASAINKEHEYNEGFVKWIANALLEYAKHELEKQGEQNPVDKVEPKFKVGDWVVDNNGKVAIIYDLQKAGYVGHYNDGTDFVCKYSNEHLLHLWTIQDANPGDVLTNGKMTVIFKHFEEPSYRQRIVAYIGLDNGGDIQITEDTWRLGIDKAKPATKEQRDLLFSKMHEAGYMWNAEKKELKKIEQKPAWSEEDENGLGDALWCCKKAASIAKDVDDLGDVWYAENWLKSLKQRIGE